MQRFSDRPPGMRHFFYTPNLEVGHNVEMKKDQKFKFKIGDYVLLETMRTTGSRTRLSREVGVVVCRWFDKDLRGNDYYVAFFGSRKPKAKPKEIPYVLRYAETSLTRVR